MADEIIRIVSSRVQYRLEDGRVIYGKLRVVENKIYNDQTGKIINAQPEDVIQPR